MLGLMEFVKSRRIKTSNRVHITPYIKCDYIDNVSEAYGVKIDPKKLIIIIDDTFFKSGKDGCIISETAIAFKEMFGKPRPIQIEKIKEIDVFEKKVIITMKDNRLNSHEFHMTEDYDVRNVFLIINEWIKTRGKINTEEYIEKIQFMEEILKKYIIPLMFLSIDEDNHQYISKCIDDFKQMQSKIINGDTDCKMLIDIDKTHKILHQFNEMYEEDEIDLFDESMLNDESSECDFSIFLIAFLKLFMKSLNAELSKDPFESFDHNGVKSIINTCLLKFKLLIR